MRNKTTLVSVIKAGGLHGKNAQRALRQHCERGNIQLVVEALGEAMLSIGMASGKIPANSGIKTAELMDRAENCIKDYVEYYASSGGIVLAKQYTTPLSLIAEIAKLWLSGFSPPIPRTFALSEKDEEILTRLTVVALKARQIMEEYVDGDEVKIPVKKLEGLCKNLSLELYRAFDNPNEANHELIHEH